MRWRRWATLVLLLTAAASCGDEPTAVTTGDGSSEADLGDSYPGLEPAYDRVQFFFEEIAPGASIDTLVSYEECAIDTLADDLELARVLSVADESTDADDEAVLAIVRRCATPELIGGVVVAALEPVDPDVALDAAAARCTLDGLEGERGLDALAGIVDMGYLVPLEEPNRSAAVDLLTDCIPADAFADLLRSAADGTLALDLACLSDLADDTFRADFWRLLADQQLDGAEARQVTDALAPCAEA